MSLNVFRDRSVKRWRGVHVFREFGLPPSSLSGWIIWSPPYPSGEFGLPPLEGGEFGLPPIGVEKLVYPPSQGYPPPFGGRIWSTPLSGWRIWSTPQLAKVTPPPFGRRIWSTPPLPRLPPSPRLLPHRGLHVSDWVHVYSETCVTQLCQICHEPREHKTDRWFKTPGLMFPAKKVCGMPPFIICINYVPKL
jgi:hypothetical protein